VTGRKKFILSILAIISIFILFILSQWVKSYFFAEPRTADSLFNQYYLLNKKNPDAAKKALEIILQQFPNNQKALRELGHWYLMQGDIKSAVKQFSYAYKIYPDDAYIKRMLIQLDSNLGLKEPTDKPKIIEQPTLLAESNDKVSVPILTQILNSEKMCTSTSAITVPTYNSVNITVSSERDTLLNEFYQSKNINDTVKAWAAITKLLQLYPNDLQALKEAGYYALNEKETKKSVEYFKRAYVISRDPYLALQLGYLLDGLDDKAEAYYYFNLATEATNQTERMKAELAKTNLRGLQVKFLPNPYYADLLFYPFYRSRFKLVIYPLISHVGIILDKEHNIRLYLSYRRTSDNKSTGSSTLPQIFEDDAAITSLGIQATPFPKIPFSTFIEAGKAVDLIYKGRSRWRSDLRSGLVYYNEWGKEARYTFDPHFTLAPNMDMYADLIYFSRYQNTIATARLRPGIEVLRYGSSSVNLYLKAFISEDYQRLFYNNILEIGPSIALTPSDRYNITIRYECLRGYYLPSGGDEINPYGGKYHNNMVFLDTYVSI
jgi:tetratricopeptide (TPR) repeat protein